MPEITSFEATKADELTAVFATALPDDAKVVIKKGDTEVSGEPKLDDAKTTYTFEAKSKLTTGTYTIELTLGDDTVTKTAEVKDEYVAEIVITSTEALVSEDSKEAYVFYDVFNQYKESIRTSTDITWTVSSQDKDKQVNKSLGKITIKNDNGFIYGNEVYLTGVHTKSGTVVTKSVKIGLTRNVDSVKFTGFIQKDQRKLMKSLPAYFSTGEYLLLFQVTDQDGNLFEGNEIKSTDLTFTNDAPLLIDSTMTFQEDKVYTISDAEEGLVEGVDYDKDIEYVAVSINPGQYVDKGGEVNITAIATKTGTKTPFNFRVGESALLQSLELQAPTDTVADGDQDVTLKYTALDTKGNAVENFETIVRSTNSLTLSASVGKLTVKEGNDGKAVITWSDEASKAIEFGCDGVARSVSLTTVVVGGTSNNLILEVADARRPEAINNISLGDLFLDGAASSINITSTDDWNWSDFTYIDQYGAPLRNHLADAFFKYASPENTDTDHTGYNGSYYAIKVTAGESSRLTESQIVKYGEKISYNPTLKKNEKDDTYAETSSSEVVKFSIAKVKTDTFKESDAPYAVNTWDDASKVKSLSHTVILVDLLDDISIGDMIKQEVWSENTANATGEDIAEKIKNGEATTELWIKESQLLNWTYSNVLKVTGSYKGSTVEIPYSYYEATTASAITLNEGKLYTVTPGAITWDQLYDATSARYIRKDAKVLLEIVVPHVLDGDDGTAKKYITISDAPATPTTISGSGSQTFNPTNTTLRLNDVAYPTNGNKFGVFALDQYGKIYWGYTEKENGGPNSWSMSISGYKENTDSLTHLSGTHSIKNNGSAKVYVEGAEIGDTMKLTISLDGTDLSTTVDVTVGADTEAYVSNKITDDANSGDHDKDFREKYLNYVKR